MYGDGIEPRKRIVFLDRDGVLNDALVRDGMPYSPRSLEELRIPEGTAAALQELRDHGFRLVVATNQPEVARGKVSRMVVEEIHRRIARDLPVDEISVCWHDDPDRCECRKPQPGLLLEAAARYGASPSDCFMVGDRCRDVEAGRRAGARTVLLDAGYAEPRTCNPDAIVENLQEAVDWIVSHE